MTIEDIQNALEMIYYIVAVGYMLMMWRDHRKGR